MWGKLDALNAERAALLEGAAPLEVEMQKLAVESSKLNDEANAVANKINAITMPRLREIDSERALLSKALSGKKRPE